MNTKVESYKIKGWKKKETGLLISENENRVLNLKYFYCINNIPVQMHYRYWDRNASPQYVEETYCYFDENGKMFYAGKRSTTLSPEEIPAKLKSIPLTEPDLSKKELYDFVIKYWELAQLAVEDHKNPKPAQEGQDESNQIEEGNNQ